MDYMTTKQLKVSVKHRQSLSLVQQKSIVMLQVCYTYIT